MAENTYNNEGSGWEALIPLVAGLLSGKSWSGEPQGRADNTGPLTPEGQALWNEYNTILQKTPQQRNISMGGKQFVVPNRQRLGLLKSLLNVDRNRTPMVTQPAQSGIAGDLAALLPMMTQGNNGQQNGNTQNNSLMSLLKGLFDSGSSGYGAGSTDDTSYGLYDEPLS